MSYLQKVESLAVFDFDVTQLPDNSNKKNAKKTKGYILKQYKLN